MPMIDTPPDALCEVYAVSLHDLALKKGGAELVRSVTEEVNALVDLARRDARFGEFLSSRIIPSKQKQQSLKTILAGKCQEMTLNFLMVLAENERLPRLPGIAAALREIVETAAGRVDVTVTTAQALSEGEIANLRERLKAKMTSGDPVIKAYTNPAMIGGIRLQVGDKLYDASVQTKLRQLREQLSVNGLPTVRAAIGRIVQA